jgi:hypothetical protein
MKNRDKKTVSPECRGRDNRFPVGNIFPVGKREIMKPALGPTIPPPPPVREPPREILSPRRLSSVCTHEVGRVFPFLLHPGTLFSPGFYV